MYFVHYFHRPVMWRNLVIIGLVVDGQGANLYDQDGREVRGLHQRHL